jgi:iron complex outermembrane receptor protein
MFSDKSAVRSSANGRIHRVLALTASLAALANADVGFAAEAQPAEAEIASGEIIVTAQRRAEALEDVPMAITAISPETFERAGVKNLSDLGQVAPGVLISYNGAVTQPSIRGITNVVAGNAFENNIAVYIDGFYTPDTVSISGDIANIAGIEVLKGPQGTLYGRNATGGAILISTLAPSDTFTGKAEISYARFDERVANGFLSGPIADGVKFSIAGYWRKSDGYLRLSSPTTVGKTVGPAAPEKARMVRAKLQVDLTDRITATAGFNYSYINDIRSSIFTPIAYAPPSLPAPPVRAPYGDLDVKSFDPDTLNEATTHEGTLKVEFDLGIGKLTSYNSYAKRVLNQNFDFDGTYAALTSSENHILLDTYQSSFDLTVDTIEKLDLVVGGSFYQDYKRTRPSNNFGVNDVLVAQAKQGTKGIAWAGFVDATYHLTDALSLTAGGRYTIEKRDVDFQTEIAVNGVLSGVFSFPPTHKEVTFKKFTPRVSLRYELAPRTNIYASYSQGFKSGGWNFSGAPSPALLLPIKPEIVDAYEIGFKTASRLFRFDIAAFYYDYRDIHVSQFVPDPLCTPSPTQPCGTRPLTTNGPKSEIYGIDGQVTFTPTEALNIRLGAAYLHARYIDFATATGTGLNPVTNVNIPSQVQDWSNKEMARSPSFSGTAGIDYELETAQGTFVFALTGSFTTSYVVNNPSLFGPVAGALANKQRYRQGGYALLNGQINWTDSSEHFYLGVFAKNLTNKRYFINYSALGSGDVGVYAAPRVVGVKAGYKF